jgi:hypothetical protein
VWNIKQGHRKRKRGRIVRTRECRTVVLDESDFRITVLACRHERFVYYRFAFGKTTHAVNCLYGL